MLNRVFGKDVIDPETGEILLSKVKLFTEDHYELFKKFKKLEFDLIASSGYVFQPTIAITLTQDHCYSRRRCIKRITCKNMAWR